ncbi:hypothetical protein [Micromonospora yangpuensis]|uniref:hypothetical protein n=1 Tax=Micromonospora yangpuensis TaxID=683228 RepID=UPI001112EEEE|nr:hypothetical protein [Micromonospora yangpuensis]GGL93665.1 hypothetical protein GCM10012279_09160 [Micromonospora yangpuensis]
MGSEPRTEREAVAQIAAEQEDIVQQHMKNVLDISRRRMHLRNFSRGLVDLYSNALDKLVK